jgi:hypothetical protein
VFLATTSGSSFGAWPILVSPILARPEERGIRRTRQQGGDRDT